MELCMAAAHIPGGKGVKAVVGAGKTGTGEDMDGILDGGIETGGEVGRGDRRKDIRIRQNIYCSI